MLIQKITGKGQKLLEAQDKFYPDNTKTTGYIIDDKWSVYITYTPFEGYHVSIGDYRYGLIRPNYITIDAIGRLGLFPYRKNYGVYSAGSEVVHFDITE
ncbi:hypothetical protein [Lactiplantibacillus plantarum]|uniref:hypothetical protein n=1 Tax=Lactiplantibacillus plantarum TaxID=1590 RepID=UPI000934BA07|nr:hypothetical protein [Lactiplantibacillus plantarum]